MLTTKPIPTRHDLSCAICGDKSGDCRQIEAGWLCHDEISAGAPINGFRHVRPSECGVWGVWVSAEAEFSKEEKQKWAEKRRASAEKRAAECLPPVVRDRQYRQLLTELSLDDADLEDLLRRGFTVEEAWENGYRTIEQWQKLDGDYLPNLPGLSQYGGSLSNCESGYVCPARNHEGLIVALQYRRRASGEGGRYRWLSSAKAASSQLANGEQPLAVFHAGSDVCAFAEGTGPKPHFLNLREGINVIGASGRAWASSPEYLRETLKAIAPKRCVLYPDGGADTHTIEQYGRLYDLLKPWGWVLSVAWWGQRFKGMDLDEVTAEQRQKAELISWQDYQREMNKDLSEIEVEWD